MAWDVVLGTCFAALLMSVILLDLVIDVAAHYKHTRLAALLELALYKPVNNSHRYRPRAEALRGQIKIT